MADLSKLSLYSAHNYMKNDESLSGDSGSATTSTTVNHNLGYIPFYEVFAEDDGIIWAGEKINQYTGTSTGNIPNDITMNNWVTDNQLVLNVITGGSKIIYWNIYKDYK